MRSPAGQRGQATVELALLLPVVMVLLLAVVQISLVVRDQILVVHAAREAARAVAVDATTDAGRKAAVGSGPLDPRRIQVDVGRRGDAGDAVPVSVRYRSTTEVPIVGPLLGDLDLHADATMRVER